MAAAVPAVTLDSFLKDNRERTELAAKLKEIARLKGEKGAAEERLKNVLIPDVTATLISYGQKKVEYDGFVHTVQPGTNVSIGQDDLKGSLLRHGIDPDVINKVLAEVVKRTTYTTITTKTVKEEYVKGGISGK